MPAAPPASSVQAYSAGSQMFDRSVRAGLINRAKEHADQRRTWPG